MAGGARSAAVEGLIKKYTQRGTDAAVLGKTIRSCAEATRVFRSAIAVAQQLAGQFFYTLAILLVLFILHQIFVWIDQDPETAFDRGALLFEVAEVTWDTTGILWNAAVDIFNAGIIPLWNAAAFYVAEPLIVLVLEIFSLIFTRQHWQGVFNEADFPYFGLDCTASLKAAQWCGKSWHLVHDLHVPTASECECADAAQVGTSSIPSSSSRPTRRPFSPTSRRPTRVVGSLTPTTRTTPLASRPRGG